MERIHRITVRKDLNDQDNHNCVVTHLEPDILECEVKWALSIITNKAGGGDGILSGLFKILKDDAVKVLCSICQQVWHRTGNGQFSFQSQRKARSKPVQTTINFSHFQYSCLENPMDRGACQATVHRVTNG